MNQTDRPWRRNVSKKREQIDVLAPVHYPAEYESSDGDRLILRQGTSFAAPIVSGVIATAYSELRNEGMSRLTPDEVQQAVVESSAPIDRGDGEKLDVFGVQRALSNIGSETEPATGSNS